MWTDGLHAIGHQRKAAIWEQRREAPVNGLKSTLRSRRGEGFWTHCGRLLEGSQCPGRFRWQEFIGQRVGEEKESITLKEDWGSSESPSWGFNRAPIKACMWGNYQGPEKEPHVRIREQPSWSSCKTRSSICSLSHTVKQDMG
jgi:hypothetical protein